MIYSIGHSNHPLPRLIELLRQHQIEVLVDVNEEGTKAAAATAVVMRGAGAPHPIPTFRADHPFLYVLRDPSSGVILFVGRVANPTVE